MQGFWSLMEALNPRTAPTLLEAHVRNAQVTWMWGLASVSFLVAATAAWLRNEAPWFLPPLAAVPVAVSMAFYFSRRRWIERWFADKPKF